jgi:hypothetical protein
MTASIFIRLPPDRAGRVVSHRLLTIGDKLHVTGCLDRIDATLRLVLTPTRPPRYELCPGCARDLDAKLKRVPAVELGPNVREVGVLADVAVARASTPNLRGARIRAATLTGVVARASTAEREWSEGGVPEMVIEEMSNRSLMR